MPGQFIFSAPFLSSEEIKLGNLIPNIKDPELDSQECPWPLVLNQDYTIKPISDFYSFFQADKDVRLSAFFTKLLRASGHDESTNHSELLSGHGNIHTLKQPKSFFHNLCRDPTTRKWLQEQIEEGMDVHLVVGFVTFIDARASDGASAGHGVQGQGAVPVTEAATGAPGGELDVKFAGKYEVSEVGGRRYLAPGEQIFGLRLKALRFRFFFPKSVSRAGLQKDTSWEMVSNLNRAASSEEAQWVEALLDDDDTGEPEEDGLPFGDDEVVFLDERRELDSDDSEEEDDDE
ncbi:hypothetical protein BDV10DRAFT_199226 [Aspergillus recurvatus]